MLNKIAAALIVCSLQFGLDTATASDTTGIRDSVIVTVDQAKLFRIPRPATTIIIGNPAIVDTTVEDDQTLVLTGRSFGVTNLIVLDINGDTVVDRPVVVKNSEISTVRIYRRDNRETLACAPVCEPTLTIGDEDTAFGLASSQIQTRNQLSEESSE